MQSTEATSMSETAVIPRPVAQDVALAATRGR